MFFLAPSPRSIPPPVSEKNGPPGAKKMRPAGSRFCARKMGTIFGARKRSPRGQHNHGARKWSRFLRPDSGHKNGPRGPPKKEAPRPKKWCAQKQENRVGRRAGRPVGRSFGPPVGRPSIGWGAVEAAGRNSNITSNCNSNCNSKSNRNNKSKSKTNNHSSSTSSGASSNISSSNICSKRNSNGSSNRSSKSNSNSDSINTSKSKRKSNRNSSSGSSSIRGSSSSNGCISDDAGSGTRQSGKSTEWLPISLCSAMY